jgi:hypothetical protein
MSTRPPLVPGPGLGAARSGSRFARPFARPAPRQPAEQGALGRALELDAAAAVAPQADRVQSPLGRCSPRRKFAGKAPAGRPLWDIPDGTSLTLFDPVYCLWAARVHGDVLAARAR